MELSNVIGPRLSDADFFAKVDISRPGLEGIPAAVAKGDFGAARRIFAAEARRTLQPERFLKVPRTFRGRHFMRSDETAEQAAARILRGELISCGTSHTFVGEVDWFINPTFNQYREWTWQLSRHPEWGILAERYRATGDEQYAAAFVRFFKSWVRQAVVPENAGGWDTLCWRTIEAGIRMGGVWHWALHTFYRSPHFTDDVLMDWYKSVWEHGWRLRNFHRTGNWLIMEMNGLAQVGVLYPQFKDAPAWKQYAFERMVAELDAQVYKDGWQVELSTGYHQVDIHNYQWLIDVCKVFDVAYPAAFTKAMERMHAVNVLMMRPDGCLPDVNDGNWGPVAPLMDNAVQDYPSRSDFVWAHSEGKQGKPPAVTSCAFDYAGYYIMRTSWKSDAVWALFDGGPFGYGHQHEDKLNVLLHAYGRLLLTEGGNYAYDASEMRKYVLSTRAHNTIRVDGGDQNRRRFYNRDAFDINETAGGRWKITRDYDVVEATFDEGYGPDSVRTVTHRRKVIFLKKGVGKLGPCLVVIDRLMPGDEQSHTYQMLWHLAADAVTVNGAAVVSADPGKANLAIVPAVEAGLSAAIVRAQETPEWQGWKNLGFQQGDYVPAPTAIYGKGASGPVRIVTVLYPTRAGTLCPIASVSASVDIWATSVRLTLADGETVEVDETGYAL